MPNKPKPSRSSGKSKRGLPLSGLTSRAKVALISAFVLVFVGAGVLVVQHSFAYNGLCNFAGNTCLNRAGGGIAIGTNVIGYPFGANENFGFLHLTGACGNGGYVTTAGGVGCPFNTYALNSRYNGNTIVEIYEYLSHSCLGNDSGGDNPRLGALVQCGNGTHRFVINDHGATYGYVEDVYWSNANSSASSPNNPRWLCSQGYRQQVNLDGLSGIDGNPNCQWH